MQLDDVVGGRASGAHAQSPGDENIGGEAVADPFFDVFWVPAVSCHVVEGVKQVGVDASYQVMAEFVDQGEVLAPGGHVGVNEDDRGPAGGDVGLLVIPVG